MHSQRLSVIFTYFLFLFFFLPKIHFFKKWTFSWKTSTTFWSHFYLNWGFCWFQVKLMKFSAVSSHFANIFFCQFKNFLMNFVETYFDYILISFFVSVMVFIEVIYKVEASAVMHWMLQNLILRKISLNNSNFLKRTLLKKISTTFWYHTCLG